jgi:peptide/nickel transport system substrate-binding protein
VSETQREWIQQPLTRKQVLRLGVGLGAAAVVGGRSGLFRTAAARAAARSTTLTVGIPNDVGGWDFDYIAFNLTGIMVLKNTYPFAIDYGLTHLNGAPVADTTKYIPVFAQSFIPDKAKKVWTLKMRPGLTWPSGNPITAEDVKWSKDRAFPAKANVAGIYRLIGLTEPGQIELVDDMTVRFHQAFPSVLAPQVQIICSFLFDSKLLKQHATSADPWAKTWANANPQAGGAYNVASYTPGQSLTLQANAGFPLGKLPIDTINLPIISSTANMRLQLAKGDIDMALGLSPNDIQQLAKTKGVKVISVPSNNQVNVELNTKMAPFDDVNVRRALAFAVPYPEIISQVYHGDARAAKSLVPIDMAGYLPSYPYSYNPSKAQSLLAKAGQSSGFSTELAIDAGDTQQQQIAIILQNAFKKVGVNVDIAQLDPATFSTRRQKKDIPMQVAVGGAWVNDIEYLLSISLTSQAFLNYSNYVNPTIEKMFTTLHTTTDPKKRIAMFHQIQKILGADVPWLVLGQPNYRLPVRTGVSDFVITPDQLPRFRYMHYAA